MKISKMLLDSGALGNGRVRHCSEWEITSLAAKSRFGGSSALRLAASRRAGIGKVARKTGALFRLPAFFGLGKKK